MKPSPTVGLALSGGGARGFAHIGVLKVLERAGVPIHCLAGTSMGGAIGAAYAAGLTLVEIEQEALRMQDARHLLRLADPTLPRRGLFEGQKVCDYLRSQVGNCTFDDLELPLTLVAVDLNGGQIVYLNEGDVVEAIRATIALPGIFKPVEKDGHLLVDGGLLNNIPANVVRSNGCDVVIAVDVAGVEEGTNAVLEALEQRPLFPSGLAETLQVVYRSLAVMIADTSRRRLEQAQPDVIIRPEIPYGVSVLAGFTRAAETIAAGEEAAVATLPRIEALLP
jgi:NTE family protein